MARQVALQHALGANVVVYTLQLLQGLGWCFWCSMRIGISKSLQKVMKSRAPRQICGGSSRHGPLLWFALREEKYKGLKKAYRELDAPRASPRLP